MKQLTVYKTIFTIIMMIAAPMVTLADPPGPGGGGDPYATPVNGGVAFVAVIAFMYGAYRLYQMSKKARGRDI